MRLQLRIAVLSRRRLSLSECDMLCIYVGSTKGIYLDDKLIQAKYKLHHHITLQHRITESQQ